MPNLRGKVALVTGAGRGVGKGVAFGLSEAGATVYITGRTVEEGQAAVALPGTIHQAAAEVSELGGEGIAVCCDHRDDAQVAALFARIAQEHGRLDILVNSVSRFTYGVLLRVTFYALRPVSFSRRPGS